MKYGELPSALTCHKLINVSFSTAQKNLAVFRFTRAIRGHQEYIENERNKLLEACCNPVPGKPGTFQTTDIFIEKFNEVLNMEVEEEIPLLPLSEEDFDNDKCQYPAEKGLWLSGLDIEVILKFCEKKGGEV